MAGLEAIVLRRKTAPVPPPIAPADADLTLPAPDAPVLPLPKPVLPPASMAAAGPPTPVVEPVSLAAVVRSNQAFRLQALQAPSVEYQ